MSVRARLKISMAISSTTAEERDLGNGSFEVVTDLPGEGGSWKLVLPANSTDVSVPLASIASVSLIALRTVTKDPTATPVNVSYKKNSNSGEATTIAPIAGQEGWLLLSTAGLTALYLTNATTTDMQVTVFALGD
jgi:hypothetical protein